jgi:glycosyltransferase involved in cell wall biosynthesis
MKSIIIPAYNEETRIKRAIENLIDGFPGQEIIVVCDGEDNSDDIIKSFSVRYPNIRLLCFGNRLGKGGALIQGFKVAEGKEICFVDADESVSIDDLKGMFQALHVLAISFMQSFAKPCLCGDCCALHHLFRGEPTLAGRRKSDCSVGSRCILIVIS